MMRSYSAIATFALALSACGTSNTPSTTGSSGSSQLQVSSIAAGQVPTTTSGAPDTISSAASTADALTALVDPGFSVANANSQNPNHGGNPNHVGNPNHGVDPNHKDCEDAAKQLKTDEDALSKSADFTAVMDSPELKAVQADIDALRKADCHDILTPSADCQKLITQFDTDLQAFWKSSTLTTLQASAAYTAVQADAKKVEADCSFGRP